MRSTFGYAPLGDRVVAYRVTGDGPVDILVCVGNGSSIEVWPEDPSLAPFFRQLTDFARVILYDPVGLGASERLSPDGLPHWSEWKDDLVAVMDAAGSRQVALFGALDGSIPCLHLAAERDERVGWLFLLNATARLLEAPDYPEGLPRAEWDAMLDRILSVWGSEDIGTFFHPGRADDPRFLAWYAKLIRSVGTPATFRARMHAFFEADLRHRLSDIACQTVVLHRKDYRPIPFVQGKYVAEHIAGARFIPLEGYGSLAGEDIQPVIEPMREAMAGSGSRQSAGRQHATVMFTDIVGSTARAERLGDMRWQELLTVHDRITEAWVSECGGRIVKTTGDGILATFPESESAARCAIELGHALTDEGLEIRMGIHTGDVHLTETGDLAGIAVNVAKRICDLAEPSNILVSAAIKQVLRDELYDFEKQGRHEIRGVTDSVELYSLRVARS